MKYLVVVVLLSGFIADSQNKRAQQIVITGTIAGDTKGYNKIYCYGNGVPADSALIVNGSFKFILPFEAPVLPLFYTEYDLKVRRGYQPLPVLIDKPGQVTITVMNISDGLNQSNVKGLRSAELFHRFTKEERNISGQIADILKQQYGKSSVPANDPDFQKINRSRDSLSHELLCPYALKFIQENADSYAAVVALFNSVRFFEFGELEDSYNVLSPELKKSKYGTEMADHIEGTKNSMIGKIIKSFTLPDADNKLFSFEQLKGKYVLLDFWASWCNPCRRSFPHMREVYEKYKAKNIEFVGISIDEKKEAWIKAVLSENNPWPQLYDSADIHKKMFGVWSIPTTFLVDTEGRILLNEVGFNPGGEIESRLKTILDK